MVWGLINEDCVIGLSSANILFVVLIRIAPASDAWGVEINSNARNTKVGKFALLFFFIVVAKAVSF